MLHILLIFFLSLSFSCSVSYPDHTECMEDVDQDRSENLKKMIRDYFKEEQQNIKVQNKEVIILMPFLNFIKLFLIDNKRR